MTQTETFNGENGAINPLSSRVQDEQLRSGGNLHVIRNRLELETADLATLPKRLRAARRADDDAAAAKQETAQKLADEAREWQAARDSAKAEDEQKMVVAGIEFMLARCDADEAGFESEIEALAKAPSDRNFAACLERANSAVIAARLRKVLPAVLERARAELTKLQTAAAALRSKYGA
jgi:hypothetical protein